MKIFQHIVLTALAVVVMTGCDALRSVTGGKLKSSQGKPYELIVVCPQKEWTGEVGDTLRSILTAPIPYLNQTEPLFDVLRVTERGFTNIVVDHRNILKVLVNASVPQAAAGVQYDLTAQPQIVVTLQAPTDSAAVAYLSQNREQLLQLLEGAERDRSIKNNREYNSMQVTTAVKKIFGIEMFVPKGYIVAKQEADFIWARNEYPAASQGFVLYSYPYTGPESLSPEALLAARNKFTARIPGPSEGSYMTTAEVYEPDFRMFRLEGRMWCEMRGFWDVAGDFMGGPFVSYTTVDTATNRVVTLDCYVFSPKLHKRNFMRGVEHLLYSIHLPEAEKQ